MGNHGTGRCIVLPVRIVFHWIQEEVAMAFHSNRFPLYKLKIIILLFSRKAAILTSYLFFLGILLIHFLPLASSNEYHLLLTYKKPTKMKIKWYYFDPNKFGVGFVDCAKANFVILIQDSKIQHCQFFSSQ